MPLISKPNYNQIFASQAPEQDKPAVFNNYPEGWGPESRPNNGKPTIKGFNYLQQTSDLKDLWILQNGACLPYDETMEYAEGAVVLKDGELQKKQGAAWVSATNKGYNLDYFVEGKLYPLHAEIMLENGDIVKSTVANNIIDPNVDMTGWKYVNDASEVKIEDQALSDYIDTLKRAKNDKGAYISIFDFCKCDGTDESAKAINAVNRANSQRVPLYIPPNAELLISGTTVLEPMYGIFGGGRIRRKKTGWGAGFAAVLLNFKYSYCNDITFLKHDAAYDDLDNVTITEESAICGWIEVTKNAKNFTIESCKFRGGKFNIFQYGGNSGLIFKNDSDTTEQAFLNVGMSTDYTRPTENIGEVDGLVIAMNRVRNVSKAPLGGLTGDGIKLMSNVKNTVILANDIQHCKGDAIDLFSSGQDVIVKGNILGYSGVKNIDIKARYAEYPAEIWGRNQQILIEGNHIFGAATDGVSVSHNDGNPPMISIKNNNIYDNAFNGIWWRGSFGDIIGNTVYSNAKFGRAYDSGIRIEGSLENPSTNVNCNSNICFNNGFTGIPAISNNCGIVLFNTVRDCNIHHNICCDYSLDGLPNALSQNYGIYVHAGCSDISMLHNRASGNLVRQIGWATGAGVVGELKTVHVSSVANDAKIPMGVCEGQYGVSFVHIQASPLVAHAENYYSFEVMQATTTGSTKIRDAFKTNAQALNLFGTRTYLPNDVYPDTVAPVLGIVKTGAPPQIEHMTATFSVVTW